MPALDSDPDVGTEVAWSSPQGLHITSMFDRGAQLIQRGRAQDYQEAAVLMRQVVERSGAAPAQYNLGILYENGFGVPKNLAMAVQWYSKAAAQDVAEAHHALGSCYEFGKGVAINKVGISACNY